MWCGDLFSLQGSPGSFSKVWVLDLYKEGGVQSLWEPQTFYSVPQLALAPEQGSSLEPYTVEHLLPYLMSPLDPTHSQPTCSCKISLPEEQLKSCHLPAKTP